MGTNRRSALLRVKIRRNRGRKGVSRIRVEVGSQVVRPERPGRRFCNRKHIFSRRDLARSRVEPLPNMALRYPRTRLPRPDRLCQRSLATDLRNDLR